jgi:hypothetical protein
VGSSLIDAPCAVTNGLLYYGAGETISGTGTYSIQEVQPSFPAMPSLDTAYYDSLMADWNARINDADSNISAGAGNLTLASDVDWSNQTISQRNINTAGFDITGTNFTVTCRTFSLENNSEIDAAASDFTINCNRDFAMTGNAQINASDYRINCSRHFTMEGTAAISSSDFRLYLDDDFDTDGTISITGYGYIVCSTAGSIMVHHAASDAGTFTATPSGGSIYFLSGGSLSVGSNQSDTTAVLNSGCYLYSRNPSGTNDHIRIRNANTTIDGATMIAERRIIIDEGADITNNALLYVDAATSVDNNYLRIADSGTTVNGAVVTRGRNDQALRINDNAAVTGLVYQYANATEGLAQADGGATVTGTLMVRQFWADSFGPATITHDIDAASTAMPPGLSGVVVEPESWDDH